MRILVITSDGFGAALAWKYRREGNEVKLWIKDPHARADFYEGIVDKTDDYRKEKGWCEFVHITNNGMVDVGDECRKWGKPVYGGSEVAQKLEKDRPASHKLMKSLGMKTPESLGVKTVAEVEKHLKEHKVRHVLKFCGKTTDSWDVFLGEYEDNRDLILLARHMEESGKKWDTIEIEDYVDGIEAGCAGYFDGTNFAPGIEVNFQGKRFAAGERGNGVGFLTGEMHTVIKYVEESNPFFRRTLGKMVPYLKEVGFRGEIDCGFIVREDGDYFIEHTPERLGIPDYVIRWQLQKTPISQLYYQMATGDVKENKYLPDWAIGVVVVSPGFPDSKSSEKYSTGLPIIGYEGNEDRCALFEAKKGKDGLELAAGGYGYPCIVTGRGPTIQSAQRRVYWTLARANEKRVYVPKSWYRDDAGERVLDNEEEIKELQILTEEEWGSVAKSEAAA